jgi:predicted phage baseplate assembly protein
MMTPLIPLDDRRWADLTQEGQALVPLYAPEWTDHNIHDPGITFVELFAWLAEMDIFQLSRIPDADRLKYIALAGVRPSPPRPARTIVSFDVKQDTLTLPAGVQVEGDDAFGDVTRFRLLDDLTAVACRLTALQTRTGGGSSDLLPRLSRGEAVPVFGDDPQPAGTGAGTALYLGFDQPLPDAPVSLYVVCDDFDASAATRERVAAAQAAPGCVPPSLHECDAPGHARQKQPAHREPNQPPLAHPSARAAWEYLAAGGQWIALDPAGQVLDDTRAFTLNGRVVVHVPTPMGADAGSYWLRCRFVSGRYDDAPRVRGIALNATFTEQALPPDTLRVPVDCDKSIRAERLGRSNGWPWQRVTTSHAPLLQSSLRVFTVEDGHWLEWQQRPDFDASGRADAHVVADPTTGEIRFGDGERGRVAPAGVRIYALYRATRAAAGNLPAGSVKRLTHSRANRQLLGDLGTAEGRISRITNPLPASGGADAESLDDAEARAMLRVRRTTRAVTAGDFEALALDTPGTHIARAWCRPGMHPAFPCFNMPGVISVIILPHLPAHRPAPDRPLCAAVAAHLRRHRLLGTRIEVTGPAYTRVTVRAQVQARAGAGAAVVRARALAALVRFFDPLAGGPDGTGWPLGRDVYRSEAMQVLDETDGVDHVLAIDFVDGQGNALCGNLCVGPLSLVDSGDHQVDVVADPTHASGCDNPPRKEGRHARA